MNQPLFLDPTISLEKVAYSTKLERDPDEWPTEILKEAYKQLPFLDRLETDVELDKVDSSRGYAVGKLMVYPVGKEKKAAADEGKLLSIPVIVRERDLFPLDVFSHNGTMRPMAADDVEGIMFQPNMFSAPSKPGSHGPSTLAGQLWPPVTDQRHGGGTAGGGGGMGKTSSERPSLIKLAANYLNNDDVEEFRKTLRDDTPLRVAFLNTPELRDAAETLVTAKVKTAADLETVRRSSTKPTVVQFVEEGLGYVVKSANHNCYAPTTQKVNRFEAERVLSSTNLEKLAKHGRVTVTADPVDTSEFVKTAQTADRFGMYDTWSGGKKITGLVVPKMIDFDGRVLDAQFFLGPDEHAMQEKVAGVFREDAQLPELPEPRGKGIFVHQVGGMALATEPVDITHKSVITEGQEKIACYHGTRLATGAPVKITIVPGLQKIASLGDFELAVPDTLKFLRYKGPQVTVTSRPEDTRVYTHEKTAGADSVELISDGTCYSIRGSNIPTTGFGTILDEADAEFQLGALGISGQHAQSFMKEAASKSSVRIPHTRQVTLESAAQVRAFTKVASVSVPDLKVSLLKEAALLTSPDAKELYKQASVVISKETVDNILSLGFVTPENASVYVEFIPELEKVSSKLAEILIASRLGMDDVREGAAKSAMTQVQKVINGLEGLRSKVM